MEHTPGPWLHQNTSLGQSIIYDEKTGETIAVTYTLDDKINKLIAAAPDQLEACGDALLALTAVNNNDFDFPKDVDDLLNQAENSITSAIAKARGGE